ncbi:ATP-binding protein [Polynucleobacter paneuropaeus]|nr:ATP-binding protein [Polynucleobacter paneuropaeus]
MNPVQTNEEWIKGFGEVVPEEKSRANARTINYSAGSLHIEPSSSLPKSKIPKILKDIPDPFEGLLKMEVTQGKVQEIQDAKFIFLNLIVGGHLIAIIGKAGSGKTAFLTYIAAILAKMGYQVIYVNADASASDIKDYARHASDHGYTLLNPDITGHTNDQVVEYLKQMSLIDKDYSNVVLVLDTLKKFTDLMAKNKGKAFYSILRALSAKGMTVICLGHCNKYDGLDGLPIYEGTGDLRSDFDELIYLIPIKNPDGSLTVSTHKDKVRAELEDLTFVIGSDRNVTVSPRHIDTLSLSKHKKQLHEDSDTISFILENIKSMGKSATDLFEISKTQQSGFTRRGLENVLKRHCSEFSVDPLWLSIAQPKYGFRYGLISDEYKNQLTNQRRGV